MSIFFQLIWPVLILLGFVATFGLSFDLVGFSFLLTTTQSALFLGLSATRRASLLLLYWIFAFTFLGLIPWLHYTKGVTIWRSSAIAPATYVDVNLMIFFSGFATFVAHNLAFRKRSRSVAKHFSITRPQLTAFLLVALAGLGFLGVLYINNFNPRLLFFRGLLGETREAVFTSSSSALVFGMLTRLAPPFAFYFAATELHRHRFLQLFLFAVVLLAVFPTGVARYFVAYTYIPILMIMLPAMRRGTNFALTLLLSLLVVFPFLDQFRYYSASEKISLLPTETFFFAAHFDAYENFASAFEAHFISDGYQLLGALLFFVPRSFWPAKPVGSGFEMADRLGYIFNNISMPFLGEGYVNFGIVGVILFGLVIGYLMGRADRTLGPRANLNSRLNYQNTVYYFLFGGVFFVFRGDLLSSFAYLSAGLVVSWSIGAILRAINSKRCR
ncbi:hypothetical protein B6V73_16555 [Thioclava sp. JM3]|uniref:O-antigen polysaccharide polymerase Wzy n=1 Tax=Thioclava sp. JM3 TaxID=1973004 RepID=UPI000B5472F2|nr:O-antigen polysaccharide polymerase Wzy [Thioclava sp. JM3]OWY14207.1 hypothetical protein B6V73_16555 [Thioclava sp. JM3]